MRPVTHGELGASQAVPEVAEDVRVRGVVHVPISAVPAPRCQRNRDMKPGEWDTRVTTDAVARGRRRLLVVQSLCSVTPGGREEVLGALCAERR